MDSTKNEGTRFEILIAEATEVFWVVTPTMFSVSTDVSGKPATSIFYPQDGEYRFLQNVAYRSHAHIVLKHRGENYDFRSECNFAWSIIS
jgi:hypothetical protein